MGFARHALHSLAVLHGDLPTSIRNQSLFSEGYRASVTPGRRTPSMRDKNSYVSVIVSSPIRSCAISSHRANRTSNLDCALQIAVCVVCTPNACTNFNNKSRSDTLVWVAQFGRCYAPALSGRLNIRRMGRAVVAEYDRQTRHDLSTNQSYLDLLAVGLNGNNECESRFGKINGVAKPILITPSDTKAIVPKSSPARKSPVTSPEPSGRRSGKSFYIGKWTTASKIC